ncbi:Elongation of very long chain fatty acids protein, partial [Armadillidium nasatum]
LHKIPTSKKEVTVKEECKETFRLTLGSYRGAVIPLLILFFGYTCGAIAVFPLAPDTRVNDWFLMDNSIVVLAICVLYVLFSVVWGPNLMKNREPFKLKRVMIGYNAFQVVLSTWGLCGWFFDYSWTCQACDFTWSPAGNQVGWLFFISKIIDFIDTLFFILNKKWSNVSVLHIVHHSCMCISMWYGIKYTPGGHMTLMGFLNSGVHSIMYTYYLLSAFGPALRPYLWWKKYLTTIQLVQFVAIFLHAAQLFVIDCPDVPIGLACWTCIYAVIFFSLFIDFYYRAYLYPKNTGKIAKGSNKKEEPENEQPLQNGNLKRDAWEMKKNLKNGHIRSPSLTFRLDSCLRERPTSSQ